MPTAVIEKPNLAAPLEQPLRKRWTRAECAVLEASGLWDQQRLELVDGEVINKMPKNRPHSIALIIVQTWLMRIFCDGCVEPETPIDVAPEDNPTSEPEPDLIVLAKPAWEFPAAYPRPEDLRLVVEISDSTLRFDLTIKAALYARAGIVEYWVFDISGRRLIVHCDPREGLYQSLIAYSEQESVRPLAAPDHEFLVGQAFPGMRESD